MPQSLDMRRNPADPAVSLLTRKLARHPGIAADDGRFLDRLLQRNQRTIRAAGALVELASPHAEILVMVEGWAMRRKVVPGAPAQIVSLHLPGDICEFNALLGTAADTETIAIGPVQTASISAGMLNEIATHPRLSRALWWEAMANGSIQRQWFANIACRSAAQRMAHLLCEIEHRLRLVDQVRPYGADGCEFACPLTQAHLGSATAMSVEHANRTLIGLRKQFGLVARAGDYTIDQPEQMREFCGFDTGYIVLQPDGRAPVALFA